MCISSAPFVIPPWSSPQFRLSLGGRVQEAPFWSQTQLNDCLFWLEKGEEKPGKCFQLSGGVGWHRAESGGQQWPVTAPTATKPQPELCWQQGSRRLPKSAELTSMPFLMGKQQILHAGEAGIGKGQPCPCWPRCGCVTWVYPVPLSRTWRFPFSPFQRTNQQRKSSSHLFCCHYSPFSG